MRRSALQIAVWIHGLTLFVVARSVMAADAENILGWQDAAFQNEASLVICGGGRLPEEVYDEFVRLAGGEEARLVLIPTAHPFDNLIHAKRVYGGWYEYDVKSLDFLDTEDRDEANDNEFVAPLRKATGVWLCGGDQGRLADIYRGTKVEALIKGVLRRGGVVGGTSAGASIMSLAMIRSGSRSQAVVDRGFGLLKHAVIDQHFLVRGRQERLLGVLAKRPAMIGFGIDEGAAIVMQGSRLRMIGASQVVVCLAETDDRDGWEHRLKRGDTFDLVAQGKPNDGQLQMVALRRPDDPSK